MSLKIKTEVVNSGVQVYQKVFETAQGGFSLDVTGLPLNGIIPAGAPIAYDESTRVAKVLKTAQVYENAGSSATAYKVKKASLFAVGDYITTAKNGKAYAITSIDASGSNDYDVLNVGTSIGAVNAGDGIFQSATTGSNNASFPVIPRGLLYEDTTIEADAPIDVVLRGTIYERRAPGYTPDIKSALPLIVFSQSY